MVTPYGETFTFIWKVENVSYFTLIGTGSIKSPDFYPYPFVGDKLSLNFYPRKLPAHIKDSLEMKWFRDEVADRDRDPDEVADRDRDPDEVADRDRDPDEVADRDRDRDEVVLSINDFDSTENRGILCKIDALVKGEVIELYQLQPDIFVLTHSLLKKIIKNEDTVTFKCYFHLIYAVTKRRTFADDYEAVTKTEIHRECLKTTINLRNAEENTLSLMSSHFVIRVVFYDEVLQVMIKQTEIEERRRKNRYLKGKFLLFATESAKTRAFEVEKYFDLHVNNGTWVSKKYKIENEDLGLFYIRCDLKTGGLQTGYSIKSYKIDPSERPEVKKHLRYVSDANEYPDIVIYVGRTCIAAHKVVLTSKSSVLAQLIETNDFFVKMNNYDLKTAEWFLDFLYYSKFPETGFQNVLMLRHMAEFYKVDTLVAKCISFQNEPNP